MEDDPFSRRKERPVGRRMAEITIKISQQYEMTPVCSGKRPRTGWTLCWAPDPMSSHRT